MIAHELSLRPYPATGFLAAQVGVTRNCDSGTSPGLGAQLQLSNVRQSAYLARFKIRSHERDEPTGQALLYDREGRNVFRNGVLSPSQGVLLDISWGIEVCTKLTAVTPRRKLPCVLKVPQEYTICRNPGELNRHKL